MYCTNCGKQLPDGVKFCIHCGAQQSTDDGSASETALQGTAVMEAPVPQSEVQPSTSPQNLYTSEPENSPQQPRKSKTLIPLLIGGCVAAVIVVGLVVYFVNPFGFFSAENESAETVTSEVPITQVTPNAEEEEDLGYGNLDDDYVLPEGSTRYYTRGELEKLDSRVLWYARNEMYAKHGKGFRNQELKQHFESKPWYVELYTADEFDEMPDQLNKYESANEDLMTQIEKERNSSYLH